MLDTRVDNYYTGIGHVVIRAAHFIDLVIVRAAVGRSINDHSSPPIENATPNPSRQDRVRRRYADRKYSAPLYLSAISSTDFLTEPHPQRLISSDLPGYSLY